MLGVSVFIYLFASLGGAGRGAGDKQKKTAPRTLSRRSFLFRLPCRCAPPCALLPAGVMVLRVSCTCHENTSAAIASAVPLTPSTPAT
ncbi:hypothetical protein FKM82_026818 [Ascaphus truei]